MPIKPWQVKTVVNPIPILEMLNTGKVCLRIVLSESPAGLIIAWSADPQPWVLDSHGSEVAPKKVYFYKFSSDAAADGGIGTTALENSWYLKNAFASQKAF